ncbi:alpha/beta hydrolase [Micromonospora peucetia]|uniref:alpha/beta fold hydrolase n=1 Tax=Micromonospora peucetia TaxID=47871 RepID=UPI002254C0FD|nr:alpha/beta fold hydrolase [Micromonospora peucetia]MCX4386499.1 alpha/beta hydrolase [Micromonospora peucetia]
MVHVKAPCPDEYHLVAPDHIGFGNSAAPPVGEFDYSFERLTEITLGLLDTLGIDRFALYLHDYGAPIGLRIASRHPERVTALVTQSGNAYTEGFTPFWDVLFAHAKDRAAHEPEVRRLLTAEATHWQYTHGVPADRLDRVAPETWHLDQAGLDRPGNAEIHLPRLSALPPRAPPAHAGHLGPPRRDLRRRRGRSVRPGPARRRDPPAGHRALRAGDPRRRDRRADPRLPAPGPPGPRHTALNGESAFRAAVVVAEPARG